MLCRASRVDCPAVASDQAAMSGVTAGCTEKAARHSLPVPPPPPRACVHRVALLRLLHCRGALCSATAGTGCLLLLHPSWRPLCARGAGGATDRTAGAAAPDALLS